MRFCIYDEKAQEFGYFEEEINDVSQCDSDNRKARKVGGLRNMEITCEHYDKFLSIHLPKPQDAQQKLPKLTRRKCRDKLRVCSHQHLHI